MVFLFEILLIALELQGYLDEFGEMPKELMFRGLCEH